MLCVDENRVISGLCTYMLTLRPQHFFFLIKLQDLEEYYYVLEKNGGVSLCVCE